MRGALSTALLALALGAAAAIFDAEPLWVPAVLLGVLVAVCSLWVLLGARGARVRRTLAAHRVLEDEPVAVLLEVRAGRLGLPAGFVSDPLLAQPSRLPAGRRIARVRLDARFARRGRRMLAPPQVELGDPLGLARRRVGGSADGDEVLVLPRLEPIATPTAGGRGDPVARRGRPVVGAEVDIDGVRPLRDGTPAARVFWPSIARNAEPQERRLTADHDGRPVVVLDPRGAACEADLDAAVRAAASLAHELAAAGGCGVLLPGDRRATHVAGTRAGGGWERVHARLAVVESGGPATPLLLAAVAQRRGAVILVSARRRASLPRALEPARGAPRVLVVPGSLPDRATAFTVAGCHGYAVGTAARRAPAPRASTRAAS